MFAHQLRNNVFVTTIFKFLGLITVTNILHFALIHSYTRMCSKHILYSFFSFGSPMCQFINHTQYEISKHYITIWVSAATGLTVWIVSKLAYQPPPPPQSTE